MKMHNYVLICTCSIWCLVPINVCLHGSHFCFHATKCMYMNAVHRELILYPVLLSQRGYTSLHRASARGQTAVVSLLLDHGADVHAKDIVSICFTPVRLNSSMWISSA